MWGGGGTLVDLEKTIPSRDYDRLKKQPENVECVNYLGSMITNDARCTREMKFGIAMVKASIQQEEEGSFHQQIGLKFKEGTSKVLHSEQFCTVRKLGHVGKIDQTYLKTSEMWCSRIENRSFELIVRERKDKSTRRVKSYMKLKEC